MTRPFLYVVGWTDLNAWYVGAKWAKGCSPLDLWTTYFTSSLIVAELRDIYGDPDHVEVLCEGNAADIVELETYILTFFRLHRHERWLNRQAGGKLFMKGPASLETRAKQSASAKSNPNHRAAMSSDETRLKISKTMKTRLADPNARAERSAQTVAYWADGDARAKRSAQYKERWADPEFKAAVLAKRQATREAKKRGA